MRFLRRLLQFPRLVRRISQFLDQLETGARSAEALLYIQTMRQVWPEAIDEIMPGVKVPPETRSDIASYYIKKSRSLKNLQRQLNANLVSMAEGLSSLSLSAKVALFEEALRIPSENTPNVLARYIRFLALYGESDDQLVEVGDKFSRLGPSIWNESFRNTWLLYLSALLRKNRVDEALDILKRYEKNYRLSEIETVPAAALFARDNGYFNRAIEQAAELMRIVRENERQRTFVRFISGKSVAVVGNSYLESGRGRGPEIDGHDIVIRFNNAPSEKIFAPDFGEKTTVLSRNLARKGFKINSAAEVILIPDGLERRPLRREMVKAFLAASRQGSLICGIPLGEYRSIMREADITHLSNGAVVSAYVKRLVPEFSRRDLYGFSHFLDEALNHREYKQFHYFEKRCDGPDDSSFQIHPYPKESQFLRSLFPNGDTHGK